MGTKEKMEQDILIAQVKASILEEIMTRLLTNKEYKDLEIREKIELHHVVKERAKLAGRVAC